MENEIRERRLQDLLRALPAEKPSDGLNGRILERVRQARSRQEKRAERNGLIWTIALSALLLAAGAAALYLYVDWSSFVVPELEDHSGLVLRVLPFGGIVLLLLIGDSLLRRHFFLKKSHHT